MTRKAQDTGSAALVKQGQSHGVYGWINSGTLPKNSRAMRRVKRFLAEKEAELIAHYGGAKIRPDVEVLIHSAIKSLGVELLCWEYIKANGILRRDAARRGDLRLMSILEKGALSWSNKARLDLQAAAELAGRSKPEAVPTIAELISSVDDVDPALGSGSEKPTAGRSHAGQDRTEVQNCSDSGESGGDGENPGREIAQKRRSPEGEGQGGG